MDLDANGLAIGMNAAGFDEEVALLMFGVLLFMYAFPSLLIVSFATCVALVACHLFLFPCYVSFDA